MRGIPTEEDWRSEPWGIDVPHAYEYFCGKSRAEAAELFVDNAMCYQEDLMFMPKRCFGYYIHSYIDYLMSEDSQGDSDGASCFFGLVECRADVINELDSKTGNRIVQLLNRLFTAQEWYDAGPEIYGDFVVKAERCVKLLR